MNKNITVLGAILLPLLIAIGATSYYFFVHSNDSKVLEIEASKYIDWVDSVNEVGSSCAEDNKREEIYNNNLEKSAEAVTLIIDSFESEQDCIELYLVDTYKHIEDLKIGITDIDCNRVKSPDKCIDLKDDLAVLLDITDAAIKAENNLAQGYIQYWSCFIDFYSYAEENCEQFLYDEYSLSVIYDRYTVFKDSTIKNTKYYSVN